MNSPSFAVITVSYDSSEALKEFLESLQASHVRPVETIIVNNLSGDKSLMKLVKSHPESRLIQAPHNLGYGGAMNLGFSELNSSPDWVVIANPDVLVSPTALSTLLVYAQSHRNIGVVGPQVREESGAVYPSARALPALGTGIGHALFANIWKNNPWTHAYKQDRVISAEPRTVGWISGAFMLIRSDVFATLKGFDEKFFMYFEDVDLCQRVHQLGFDVHYLPQAVITHMGAHSTKKHKPVMLRAHHRSAYLYLSDQYSAWYLWPLRIMLKVSLTVRSFWGSITG